jgi:hypothetical protein
VKWKRGKFESNESAALPPASRLLAIQSQCTCILYLSACSAKFISLILTRADKKGGADFSFFNSPQHSSSPNRTHRVAEDVLSIGMNVTGQLARTATAKSDDNTRECSESGSVPLHINTRSRRQLRCQASSNRNLGMG